MINTFRFQHLSELWVEYQTAAADDYYASKDMLTHPDDREYYLDRSEFNNRAANLAAQIENDLAEAFS